MYKKETTQNIFIRLLKEDTHTERKTLYFFFLLSQSVMLMPHFFFFNLSN